ncbi:uncharacterized protein ATC70_006324 [Mucor velutinosus]|uniref:Uncharacterized protein n=1 Tax=Mucor velutinosus TaxID=708070 RepID=A0AAN7D3Q7_9FUNG|nr:hypothetical protein ATC70_006324 [Mucor velutinosus]
MQEATSYTTTATTLVDGSQIFVSTSRTMPQTSVKATATTTIDSSSTSSTETSYELLATESNQIPSTTDNNFIRETPTSVLSMNAIVSTKTIASFFSRPTSRLLAPPKDRPLRDKSPISSSLIPSASTTPSPSTIQPIPAKVTTNSSTKVPASTTTHTNETNDDDNSAYYHKAQIHSSIRDLGLGLGLGFGGFSILVLAALLIQNYQKRQRNQSSFRTSNHIDDNGVFFTEKPSIFKRKSASRNSKQASYISTKWRSHSFLGVVANAIAATFSKRGSSNSFSQFGESRVVDYDPLTYPQPLYSPVKATYQDM